LTPHHHSPLHHRRFPPPRHIPSFPTRRSSDLGGVGIWLIVESHGPFHDFSVSVIVGRTVHFQRVFQILNDGNRLFVPHFHGGTPDRKSTRLNSSHVKISYAVFCLKKKNERV